MKKFIKFIMMSVFSIVGMTSCESTTTLQTVAYVDLEKYAGTWYEIASYPQYFERGCSNVTATYSMKDNYVEVFNECLKAGKSTNIKGKAFVVEGSGNAKLKVQFFWPLKANYWIIDLADDYSWAVVSDPNRKTLWILSRTPNMDSKLYESIVDSLVNVGFEKDKIVKMKQDNVSK
jgi:apolipoprotein D and lipocalin family protein